MTTDRDPRKVTAKVPDPRKRRGAMNLARKSLIPLELATLAMAGLAGAGTAHAASDAAPLSAEVSA
jgi:hypothetical protein